MINDVITKIYITYILTDLCVCKNFITAVTARSVAHTFAVIKQLTYIHTRKQSHTNNNEQVIETGGTNTSKWLQYGGDIRKDIALK